MLSLLAAVALTQTYPLLTNQTINLGNTPNSAGLSIIGAGEVDVVYSQSGAAAGNMTLSAVPVGLNGQPIATPTTSTINPSVVSSTIALTGFVGTGVNVSWAVNGPTDYFTGVTLSVVARPTTPDGGTASFTNITANSITTSSISSTADTGDGGAFGHFSVGGGAAVAGLMEGHCTLASNTCNAVVTGSNGSTYCVASSQSASDGGQTGCSVLPDGGSATITCNATTTGVATTWCWK